jgi:DNA gyrase subunit A
MTTESNAGRIRPVRIEDEMRTSYLDYAMSVIVSRALPDVRDGLKPVQRRILYAMAELGLRPNSAFKKSARIVGEVLGKYHPHGDSPVYEAMVRMAQDFSMRYPLVEGQGNFGSVDNDPPAAMRYTEARLAPIAEELLADIDRNTVDFAPNFDDSLREPVVLPARLPNLLVNGAAGIAVGMATSIPPHNLGEICDAICLLIENPETTTEELCKVVKGPDFPTGGIIYRMRRDTTVDADGNRKEIKVDGIRAAYADGRGRIVMKARARIEESARGGREQIVVTELPYQVNKAALVQRIAELVKDRKIDGISDLRDESDRHGMRIVIELSRGGQARRVLNALYRYTAMQSAFPVNMVALVDGQPRTLGLKEALLHYIDHRRVVIRRRTEHDLEKAREREHILQGYLIALNDLDAVIQTIRKAKSADDAKTKLMGKPWGMSERQAQAVLDMQLRRLAQLERQKIEDEYKDVIQQINYLEDLLANPRKIDFLIAEDAQDIKKKYGDERRTVIVSDEAEEVSDEDLIAHQEVVVTLSQRGAIKRQPLETYRVQRRGGRGVTGMVTREADAVHRLIVCDTHDHLLYFTERGRVFQSKAYEVPDAKRTARGVALVNIVDCPPGESVTALVAVHDYDKDYMVMATAKGEVKKTPLSEFKQVRRNGLIAMDLEPDDHLVNARLATDDDDIVLVTSDGQAIRFPVRELRAASRASGGVRGIKLNPGAAVIGMDVVAPGHQLFTISEKGFGKRTPFEDYPRHHRGGGGVRTYNITAKTGPLVAARTVSADQELVLVSREGIILRTRMDSIRQTGRAAQGVSVMNIGEGDAVAAMAVVTLGNGAPANRAPSAPPEPGPDDANAPERRSRRPSAPQKGAKTRAPSARTPRKRS